MSIILCIAILLVIGLLYFFSRKSKLLARFCSPLALCITAFLMLASCIILGLVRQDANSAPDLLGRLGFRSLKDSPWFISTTLLFLIVLGMFTLERFRTQKRKVTGFLASGIFVTVLGLFMSNITVERYLWSGLQGSPKWEVIENGTQPATKKLPFAIEVSDYRTDFYPPVIYIVESKTGKVLPIGAPQSLPIDPAQCQAYMAGKGPAQEKQIQEWKIKILEYYPQAWVFYDSGQYQAKVSKQVGNAPAAKVELSSSISGENRTTWLSCGSDIQLPAFLRLDSARLIGMEDPVPSRYVAQLKIYEIENEKGVIRTDSVWPNHPLKVDGYAIYLKSLKQTSNFWDRNVQLELVKDPWSPCVYAGLTLILLSLFESLLQALFRCKPRSKDS